MIAEAEAFNLPLDARSAAAAGPHRRAAVARPSVVRADRPNVTVEAVKQADREDALVVRVTEAWGARGRVADLDDLARHVGDPGRRARTRRSPGCRASTARSSSTSNRSSS